MTVPMQIDVATYAAMRQDASPHILVDVREPWEVETASVDGALNIPLGTLVERAGELPKDQTLVVMCHHGGRSLSATRWLRGNGWDKAINLDGGIDAWSHDIDESIPRY